MLHAVQGPGAGLAFKVTSELQKLNEGYPVAPRKGRLAHSVADLRQPCASCMATLPVRGLEVAPQCSTLVAGEGKGVSAMKRILAALFSRPDRRALEQAYLSQAVSLYDLEQREREIEQGLFSGR